MKPSDVDGGPGRPNQIKSHPPPTLRSKLITAVSLFTTAGALFLALWVVDQMVSN
ncbi:MAG TPA: hypothetical protein VNV82_06840 [Bryobacteraceae bacterium]|jgi:hypothetical protein|nr:hypothetical protein [Bryobacteraceae bacterium]